jgi:hypothetical protein
MKASSYFGYKCPKCNSTIDIAAVLSPSAILFCENCGTEMVPNPNGRTCAANVYCPKCHISFGLVNSDTCPECGGPFSKEK